ncbi:hypothetical protein [Georhizobium sp. MAB10]|uniref:hypothetical protein n=1 Tax=Georhizobium sp. MAB10 TaxID=3028319 RepID=UPI00385569E9
MTGLRSQTSSTSKATLKIGNCILAEKPKRYRADWKPSRPHMRRAEVEKVIRSRHGGMIPDPGDTDDRDTCLAYIRAAAFSLAVPDMPNWCSKWAPWVTPAEVGAIVAQAFKRRRMMNADGVAGLLTVTMEERTRLKLKTIGACDVSKAERVRLAKERKRQRDRERQALKRRATGSVDRASHEAQSLSRLKPWEAENISRRTWERRRVASASRIDIHKKGDGLASKSIGNPFPAPDSESASGAAGRAWGLGVEPPAELQEAEPHGTCDGSSEVAA